MKKTILACALLSLTIVACETERKSAVQRKSDEYALVKVATPDLSGISDNGKEVLNLYKFAADQADSIYWLQAFGEKSLMTSLEDKDLREYAMINYGPWDRVDGQAFVEGYGQRPLGANLYPADMSWEEYGAFDDPLKANPYTVLTRDSDGKLKATWYHEAYKYHVDKIHNYLKAAADITIRESVRKYLLAQGEALANDDYESAAMSWLDMTDSKMDLIIGPNEVNDDQLLGKKRSYEAYVLLKDEKRTEALSKFTSLIPEMQKRLPCDEAYKTFVPGNESDVYAYDAIYCAGHANAGVKLIALNLPYDPEVQATKGTRTVLLRNIMSAKFNKIINPVGMVVLNADQHSHLSDEAFYWTIAFREMAHGLGVKETINGKGTVENALGNKALTWEDAKANVLGLYLLCGFLDEHMIPGLTTKEDAITTFFANLVRSQRFGTVSQLGRAYEMVFNYMYENGAFSRGSSGKYSIDFAKTLELAKELTGIILKTQATGDYAFASSFEDKYCVVSDTFKADLMNIRLENIPLDIKFEFEK